MTRRWGRSGRSAGAPAVPATAPARRLVSYGRAPGGRATLARDGFTAPPSPPGG
jgi:hypothetical protein